MGNLKKGIFSIMYCIIHLWVFFPCALAENNGAFVDQKITESAARSNRNRLQACNLQCNLKCGAQTTALKRGGEG